MKALLRLHFLHYKFMGNVFWRSRASNSEFNNRISRNSNSSEISCMSWLPANLKKDPVKLNGGSIMFKKEFSIMPMGKYFNAQRPVTCGK